MGQLVHGGDIYSYSDRHSGREVVDFSANINPLGMPENVRKAAIEAVDLCHHYPDPLCRKLRRTLQESEQLPEDWLFCGNGASDVLYRLAKVIKPERALISAPTFSEYETALTLEGCEMEYHYLLQEESYKVTERILSDIRNVSAVILCNPNNPTGSIIEPELMGRILERCREIGAYLVIDECFLDFLNDPGTYTMKGKLESYPRLVLLRAFTKMFALPGIRLGYCICADAGLIKKLYGAGPPWNVSVIAQNCGIAALHEARFVEESRRYIKTQREYLHHALSDLGFQVYDGCANYLFFQNNRITELPKKLEERGYLIRACANYRGLDGNDFRIAVKTLEENRRLIQALTDICTGEGESSWRKR